MTKKERRQLHAAMKQGSNRAREALWQDALRLVIHTETRLRKGFGLEEADEDMIQEGAIAAGQAVDSWDPDRASFSTWVITNVKGRMLDYLNEQGKAGIGSKSTPVAVVDMEEGVAYSPELSGGEDLPGVKQDGAIPRSELLTYEGVRIGDATDGAGYVPAGFENLDTQTLHAQLRDVIKQLPIHDEIMLRSYYGLDVPRMTLAEMCELFGYSPSGMRKRITNIEQQVRIFLETR